MRVKRGNDGTPGNFSNVDEFGGDDLVTSDEADKWKN